MTQADHRTLRVGRVVLEAISPLSITSGAGTGSYDTAVMLDANGLPTIPATSLKGVIRNMYRARYGDDGEAGRSEQTIFGYVEGDSGAPARLQVAWGWCHDARGIPVVGRLVPSAVAPERFSGDRLEDALLRYLLGLSAFPVVRERVRLTHQGAAERNGKFDRSVVPAGTRFTVEFCLEGFTSTQGDDALVWDRILALLSTPGLRLGGATRSGLGLVAPVASGAAASGIWERAFVLDQASLAAFRIFRQETAANGTLAAFQPVTRDLSHVAQGGARCITLDLEAESTWLFGGEGLSLEGAEVDRAPKTEPMIIWVEGTADVAEGLSAPLLIPGSSVKGALRHRTAFHYRRAFLDAEQAPDEDHVSDTLATLFGREKRERNGSETGRPGLVNIDDLFKARTSADVRSQTITHVSIDRFTGGARRGLLFDEQVLVGGRIGLKLWLAPSFDALPEPLRQAFWEAVEDLKRGWLALGAGASRGHGRFRQSEAS